MTTKTTCVEQDNSKRRRRRKEVGVAKDIENIWSVYDFIRARKKS